MYLSPGLGTSTSKEAKEYFSDMTRHRIPFKYSGPADDEAITLVTKSLFEFVVDTIEQLCKYKIKFRSDVYAFLCLSAGL